MSESMHSSERAVDMDVFERRFLAHASSQLAGRDDEALAALARDVLEFGAEREDGRTMIRVQSTGPHATAIDIVTTDAPYLVDSVRSELVRRGLPPEHILHPQLVVARDADGRLQQVFDLDDNATLPDGAVVESWTHLELDVLPEGEHVSLTADLQRVLEDVHHAVGDAPDMYRLIRDLADRLVSDPGQFDRETSEEAGALLRWLADGNYMILGHAAYSANELANPLARAQDEDAEGVLRGAARISPLELLPAFRSGAPLVIFKSPLVSTVRRSARYDCVTVLTPDTPQMVHVFLGLITNAEDGTVGRVPVVRRRIAEIMLRSGVRADSHTGRQLLAALRTLPRDELLEAPDRRPAAALATRVRPLRARDGRRVRAHPPQPRLRHRARLHPRPTGSARRPASGSRRSSRGTGRARSSAATTGSSNSTSRGCSSSSPSGPGTQPARPDRDAVEAEVSTAIRRWSDDLHDIIIERRGEDEGERIFRRYEDAFPEAYKEDFPARIGVRDLGLLHNLPHHDGLAFSLDTCSDDDDADRRLKVFRTGQPVSLARALPIFTQMGIEVLDERPYELDLPDRDEVWVYDFGLRLPPGVVFDEQRSANVVETIRLLWRAQIEQDGFNALVVQTDLNWWQANILRTYAKYLRQAGTAYSQGYIEQALVEHPDIAVAIVDLFEARFDPERGTDSTDTDRARRGAGGTARRGVQPGPGLDPALAARPRPRDVAHERLPHRRLSRPATPGCAAPLWR